MYLCVCFSLCVRVFVCAHIYEKLPQKFLHSPQSFHISFPVAGKRLVGACIGIERERYRKEVRERQHPVGHPLYHFPVHKSMGDALVLISRSICFASKQTTTFPSRSHIMCMYVCVYVRMCVRVCFGRACAKDSRVDCTGACCC